MYDLYKPCQTETSTQRAGEGERTVDMVNIITHHNAHQKIVDPSVTGGFFVCGCPSGVFLHILRVIIGSSLGHH